MYLPSFGVALAVALAPIALPMFGLQALGISIPEWILRGINATEFVVMGLIFYGAHLTMAWLAASLFADERRQLLAVAAALGLPTLFYETWFLGPNMVVATFALGGIVLATRDRWFVAAVLVGFATFKFTAIPLTAVLFGYAVLVGGRTAALQTVAGGIASQLPNLVYFATQPDELLLILREHGAISSHANTLGQSPYHAPIEALGIGEWYFSVGFLLGIIICSVLGIAVAVRVRGRAGLLAGFTLGYFATSFLAPAEQRYAPFLVFVVVLVLLADRDGLLSRRATTTVIVGLFVVEIYPVFLATGVDGPVLPLLLPATEWATWIHDLVISGCGLALVARYGTAKTIATERVSSPSLSRE